MKLPALRALSLGAGVLLAVSLTAAAALVAIGFTANASQVDSLRWPAAILGILQIVCIVVIWQIFVRSRGRFTDRLQAITGSLDDQVFLAAEDGTLFAVLDRSGWAPAHDWLEAVHPEDRAHWPVKGAAEPQRIELRLRNGEGDWRWHRLRASPLLKKDGRVEEWIGTLHDIHEQKLASERRDLVIGELRHRLKNLLTVIDALAKNSRRPGTAEPGVEPFLQRFLGRLHALGAAGDLVLAGNRVAIDAASLVRATLSPFMSENTPRFRITGPDFHLSEELGAGLGLAMHELATNALKYGALSVPEGRVSLTWSVTPNGNGDDVVFEWKERGGPTPTPPEKPGFGTRMIKYVTAREKNGNVDIDYPADGLYCRIAFWKDKPHAANADS